MQIQHFPLGARAYDIYIGRHILKMAAEILGQLNPSQKSVVIITEQIVADLYLSEMIEILSAQNYQVHPLILPVGEGTKSLHYFEQAMNFCLNKNVARNHAIIALGGGVIGDLTGFVAATLRRGCRFIQIPTTLLSQVDSSVGGKTAINSAYGKNLIGAFYQPSAVIIDTQFINSLPERVYRSGYAEVIKYGILGDKAFFEFLKHNVDLYKTRNQEFLTKVIAHSVKMKADIVCQDETEQSLRALLNLGHTFAHAYEAETGYSDTLYHGEAVAIGMYDASAFSVQLGYLTQSECNDIKTVLLAAEFNLNICDYIPNFSTEKIIHHMQQDKKVLNDQMVFILLKNIGNAYIDKNISKYKLIEYLNKI